MAFGFSDVVSGIAGAADIASSIFGISEGFGGVDESKSEEQARKASKEAEALAVASADPTSAKFKNLAALFESADRRRSIESVQRTMRESSRARARGDVGFGINPERRDEARYGALAQAFMLAKERSRGEAREALLNASRAITGAGAAAPVQAATQRETGNFNRQLSAVSSIAPTIQSFSELFRQPEERQLSSVAD